VIDPSAPPKDNEGGEKWLPAENADADGIPYETGGDEDGLSRVSKVGADDRPSGGGGILVVRLEVEAEARGEATENDEVATSSCSFPHTEPVESVNVRLGVDIIILDATETLVVEGVTVADSNPPKSSSSSSTAAVAVVAKDKEDDDEGLRNNDDSLSPSFVFDDSPSSSGTVRTGIDTERWETATPFFAGALTLASSFESPIICLIAAKLNPARAGS